MTDRKMTKSKNNRLLTGTLAGIAEYFGWSTTVVRIVYLVFTLLTAHFMLGIFVYVLLMALIPSQTPNDGLNSWFNMMNQGFNRNHDYSHKEPRQGRKILHDVEEKDDRKR